MKWSLLTWLLPEEAVPVFLVLSLTIAGMLMIVGLRKMAVAVIVFVVITAFLPVFDPAIEGLVEILPPWALILILAAIAFTMLKAVTALFVGEKNSDKAWGAVLMAAILFVLLLPFRMVGWLLKLMFR